MKRLLLVLVLLPSAAFAQSGLPNFLHHSMKDVGKSLEKQHLACDTSFRYKPGGPTVAFVAYAPYKLGDIPGVLILEGEDSISGVTWYSRGVNVDSDLSYVISRNPNGNFHKAVETIGDRITSPEEFNKLVEDCETNFGKASHHASSTATWPQCRSAWINDGVARVEASIPFDVHAVQGTRYSKEKTAQVRATLSPGLRGLSRKAVMTMMAGKYEASFATADSGVIAFAPYDFHGIPGVLKTSFDKRNLCVGLSWMSNDPDFRISHPLDTTTRYSQIVRALDDQRVTDDQYALLRAEVGLPALTDLRGQRHVAYFPVHQRLNFEIGRLDYEEAKTPFPIQRGLHLMGCEPTMDPDTGE